jgi:hypothetical protein
MQVVRFPSYSGQQRLRETLASFVELFYNRAARSSSPKRFAAEGLK